MENERELVDAILRGDDGRLAELLKEASDLESLFRDRIETRPTNHAIGYQMTLLQLASFRTWGSGTPASVLMQHGEELDFHSACGLGRLDRLSDLFDSGTDVLAQTVDDYYPIQFAISGSQPDVIRFLCEQGDAPNRSLRKVAYFGWEDDILASDFTPWRPIHMATLWGFDAARVPVLEALLSNGAEIHSPSPLDGYLPLHLAAMPNRVEMIRFLVSRGAEIDRRTADSRGVELSAEDGGPISGNANTALMVAAAEGAADAVECLLQLGADPSAANSESMTALDFARQAFWPGRPYDKIVALLNGRSQ